MAIADGYSETILIVMAKGWNIFENRAAARGEIGPLAHAQSATPAVCEEQTAYEKVSRTFIDLTYTNLLWIFLITSVVGLVGETLVSWPIDGELRHRFGLLWGPFSPIYGLGAVLITVALNNLRQARTSTLFAVAGLVGSSLEFVGGWFWKNFFGVLAWSYEGQPFNLFGYTSLGMACCWGLIGMVWMKMALPIVMKVIEALSMLTIAPITAALSVFLAADIAMTFATINCWFDRLDNVPVSTPIEQFCATHFDNEFMQSRFGVMTIHTDLAEARHALEGC